MIKTILEVLPVFIFSYAGQVLLRRGAAGLGPLTLNLFLEKPWGYLLKLLTSWQILAGVALAGVGAFFYIIVLSKNDLSIILPILGSMAFILLPFIGMVFLGEPVTLTKILGICCISGGMIVLTLKQ